MDTTGVSVAAFVAGVAPAKRRRDADTLIALMRDISGREPEMWTSGIIGFGRCHYRYSTGTEGDMPLLAFAPRKPASTVYLDEIAAHTDALAALGPHTSSVSCLYLKDLELVDMGVLRGILQSCFDATIAGGPPGAEITITG
ncbi:MAG: hypothetical protein ABS62_00620 [Microbacterium sp. SCN 70-200]|uniref:DUF1801 domain-containing protein n=1 Tax=unclassified Microbacterium TaxID=2609290 RepID=UPI00086A03A0|nr:MULTISPECIES: DUF1801 domain-containing protein [unclassified Microbacterium]MBN9214978.1 DUF1801 domain-containing protein [Microbacterium sp.]ODT42932.1 MAG: hypothetical protein ABS62_00620 [Microbacterium sp. SCN 70-200]OJV84761.1 MAG: hypothetical protein BGO46_05130 [Microbacterium sp. 70-16]